MAGRGTRQGWAALIGGLAASSMAPAASAQPGATASAPAPARSAQRRAILDALRPAVAARLGGDVEFVVSSIQVRQGWAVVIAEPQRRGGAAIDGAAYFPADDWDFMDGLTTTAVLSFRNGGWQLVDHAIGATDVWYCGDVMPAAVARGFGC